MARINSERLKQERERRHESLIRRLTDIVNDTERTDTTFWQEMLDDALVRHHHTLTQE